MNWGRAYRRACTPPCSPMRESSVTPSERNHPWLGDSPQGLHRGRRSRPDLTRKLRGTMGGVEGAPLPPLHREWSQRKWRAAHAFVSAPDSEGMLSPPSTRRRLSRSEWLRANALAGHVGLRGYSEQGFCPHHGFAPVAILQSMTVSCGGSFGILVSPRCLPRDVPQTHGFWGY